MPSRTTAREHDRDKSENAHVGDWEGTPTRRHLQQFPASLAGPLESTEGCYSNRDKNPSRRRSGAANIGRRNAAYTPIERKGMTHQEAENHLPESRRKESFPALVDAQDRAVCVLQSRHEVGNRFHVSVGQIRQIEREGLDNQWPPL
jgi:hypothetical protein